ncbi:radical activating enzyme [Sphingomonas metalli]|uniref:Radical activating enzyme n=1 Tax=Sphingomonas metalli TaxID=1779358 RepID=A0A916WYN8_9SPHN|nr:4Fe-4S single cluster domain-containing protein [Sphingomonas metalli]GGB39728.1 radical activating enzyme [Sphingomonas metalli]
MTTVSVSRLHFPVTALGPGRRAGLWLQGCSIRCPGCISVDTWEPGLGTVPVAEVLDRLAAMAREADGLTVSGGEPFDQPDALAAVLAHWRAVSGSSTLVFTGRELDEVKGWLSDHPDLIDALVTGPFRPDLPQTLALRGSDNQRIHALTAAGVGVLSYDRPATAADRRLDVAFDEQGHAWLAGIPARGEMARLRRALAAAGHLAVTSDMVGALS